MVSLAPADLPSLWWNPALLQPWRFDVGSDVFESAAPLAAEYEHLVDSFYKYSDLSRNALCSATQEDPGE